MKRKMKKLIYTCCLIALVQFTVINYSYCQDTLIETIGFFPTRIYDTIQAKLLISYIAGQMDAMSSFGYIIREKYVFKNNTEYKFMMADEWRTVGFLNDSMKKHPARITVWQAIPYNWKD